MFIESFDWDDQNICHISRHQVGPDEVIERSSRTEAYRVVTARDMELWGAQTLQKKNITHEKENTSF